MVTEAGGGNCGSVGSSSHPEVAIVENATAMAIAGTGCGRGWGDLRLAPSVGRMTHSPSRLAFNAGPCREEQRGRGQDIHVIAGFEGKVTTRYDPGSSSRSLFSVGSLLWPKVLRRNAGPVIRSPESPQGRSCRLRMSSASQLTLASEPAGVSLRSPTLLRSSSPTNVICR